MVETKKRKTLVGTVQSDKMEKTIVVKVERLVKHPVYKKTMKKTVKYKAHDEKNEAHTGDRVMIEETRPLSKEKRWQLIRIVEKSA